MFEFENVYEKMFHQEEQYQAYILGAQMLILVVLIIHIIFATPKRGRQRNTKTKQKHHLLMHHMEFHGTVHVRRRTYGVEPMLGYDS